jgi:hypothetical protein
MRALWAACRQLATCLYARSPARRTDILGAWIAMRWPLDIPTGLLVGFLHDGLRTGDTHEWDLTHGVRCAPRRRSPSSSGQMQ